MSDGIYFGPKPKLSGKVSEDWEPPEAELQHIAKEYKILTGTNFELENRIIELENALTFCLHAAEYVYGPNKPLEKGLCPSFYHTLTYEGDLELIEKTKEARKVLENK